MSLPDGRRQATLARTALPVVAIVTFALTTVAVLVAAGDTLGYDFLAYHAAARRVLDGGTAYDLGFSRAGGFGLFYYPPTFLPLILPFGLIDPGPATSLWIAGMTAALLAGIWLLPVSRSVRWLVLLLAATSWPVLYTLKLGQVTPILFLLAVLGWRALERGGSRGAAELLGASAALGAAIKIQPGLSLVWAAASGRWRAVLAGGVVLLLALLATIPLGAGSWVDYVTLLRQVVDPVATEHNATPGWIARSFGLSAEGASAVEVVVIVAALAAVVGSIRWSTPTASYLVTVTASQLVSPVLWDHYAMVLLLPVAWLLARGYWWAVLVPLVTSLPLVLVTPLAAYPVLFAVTLLGVLVTGARQARQATMGTGTSTSPATA